MPCSLSRTGGMTRISVWCLGALDTFSVWSLSSPPHLSHPCYPAQYLALCCSGWISQEATPANGVPRSIAQIPWCHSCLPHANCSGIVTELAYHTECLLRPGQLHRPLSPCPRPDAESGPSPSMKSHMSLSQPISPWFMCPVPEDSFLNFGIDQKLSVNFQKKVGTEIQCGAQDTLGSLPCHVINQCDYLSFIPYLTVATLLFPASLAVRCAHGNKLFPICDTWYLPLLFKPLKPPSRIPLHFPLPPSFGLKWWSQSYYYSFSPWVTLWTWASWTRTILWSSKRERWTPVVFCLLLCWSICYKSLVYFS